MESQLELQMPKINHQKPNVEKKKRAQRVFIPEHLKDAKYWERRARNNYHARKSRALKKTRLQPIINKKINPKSKVRKNIKQIMETIAERRKNAEYVNKILLEQIHELKTIKDSLIRHVKISMITNMRCDFLFNDYTTIQSEEPSFLDDTSNIIPNSPLLTIDNYIHQNNLGDLDDFDDFDDLNVFY